MHSLNPQYITDNNGKKISAIIPIDEFQSILEELEELEDIRSYDEAKKGKMEFSDAENVFKEIEAERNQKHV